MTNGGQGDGSLGVSCLGAEVFKASRANGLEGFREAEFMEYSS